MTAYHDAVGIDLDVYPRGLSLGDYRRMHQLNGTVRTVKTVARKMLGVDRSFWREVARHLDLPSPPAVRNVYMNAEEMTFGDGEFDLAYSFDVFEHLPKPGKVLDEIKRVLKPGGVSYHVFLPITAELGYHDLRIIARNREGVPYWAHLRPERRAEVQNNSYLNELTIADWRKVFAQHMPDARLIVTTLDDPVLNRELAALRSAGELSQYSDEDLLLDRMTAVWVKPKQAAPASGPTCSWYPPARRCSRRS